MLMQGAILTLAALAGGVLYWRMSMKRRLRCAGVRELGADETRQLIDEQQALVVDVREEREYHAGRIPDARHMPLGQVQWRLKELERYRDRPIVVSCRSGRRSASACLYLCQNGFSSVYNLKGGLIAWQQAEMELEI